jgi:hypothetical protein
LLDVKNNNSQRKSHYLKKLTVDYGMPGAGATNDENFADRQVTGQGHGMPCPCKNVAWQHIDIEY